MVRPEFISRLNYIRGGHLLDLDWLWTTLEKEDPLDIGAVIRNLKKNRKEFVIVATSIESGEPLYLSPDETSLWHILKVSSSIPVLYRNFLPVDSTRGSDGGISDPIPVAEAYRRGARRIVVIRSRVAAYVKKRGLETTLTSLCLKNHPSLKAAVRRQADIYREAVAFINAPPRDARIVHIAPEMPLLTSRTSQVRSDLDRDYARGVEAGRGSMSIIKNIFDL